MIYLLMDCNISLMINLHDLYIGLHGQICKSTPPPPFFFSGAVSLMIMLEQPELFRM